jgi:hypothetical protein
MKTTFDLPEPLLRRAKAAAAHQGRPLRELVAEAIDAKLVADSALVNASTGQDHGWKAYAAKLVKQADGTWVNPDGIDDERFFQALEDIRAESRLAPLRDPFAGFASVGLDHLAAAPAVPVKPAARPRKAAASAARKRGPR